MDGDDKTAKLKPNPRPQTLNPMSVYRPLGAAASQLWIHRRFATENGSFSQELGRPFVIVVFYGHYQCDLSYCCCC